MKIGITGHQQLGDDEIVNWLRSELIERIRNRNLSQAYSSLAIGADQLFAKIVIEFKIPLTAVIPCEHYEKTFDLGDVSAYKLLLGSSVGTIRLPHAEPSEHAFFDAGKYIVDHCDLLFAIWDGEPAKGLGGTADIVNYAQHNDKEILHLNPKTFEIINYGK